MTELQNSQQWEICRRRQENKMQKLTLELAKKINALHGGLHNKARLMIQDALEIGEILDNLQISHNETFAEWVEKNLVFSRPTAYRYISLFNYKKQISTAENLTDAYKMIETFEAQKKQKETANAYQRVSEFKKTGIKPEGWRRGTDDKLAKEDIERDARIEAVKQEALERKTAEQEREREKQKAKINDDNLYRNLNQTIKALDKRVEFKEKIRVSAEGMADPFQDALIDYLDGLEDDNRRIEACYNIIKICKKIANDLQKKN